jgi:hypothetical protein
MRNTHTFFSTVLILLLASRTVFAETPSGLLLYLLIGQSNMAGRGKVTAADEQTSPRVLMLDKACAWIPAKDPVHFDKPKVAGVGLCSEFARCVAAKAPEAKIGLVPCAFGGTSMDQWKPGSALYTNAVARMKVAQKHGQLMGILWHQGEADSAEAKVATYPARFAAMIAQLRQDLDAEEIPVMVGELGHFRPASAPFNAMLPQVAAAVPRCAVVSAEGLGHGGDSLHFDRDALRTFGKRYFEAYEKMGQTSRSAPTKP